MSDLINRQAAIDAIEERLTSNGYSNVALVSELNRCVGYIMRIPAAPVREVMRGHWIGIDDEPHETWECDQCGLIQECFDGDQWKFCPNCGADMREVTE